MTDDQKIVPVEDQEIEPQKHAGGRPTTYKPVYCDMVIALGREGKSIAQMALELQIPQRTLYEWKAKFPEFSQSISDAVDLAQGWYENKAQQGLDSKEFNSYLWAKVAACRWPDTYRENRHSMELTGKGGGAISITTALQQATERLVQEVVIKPDDGEPNAED